MRFIDANVFVHATLRPKQLTDKAQKVKDAAVTIFKRFNAGEDVFTTAVHLSEVANVLEDAAGPRLAANFVKDVLSKPNLQVETVSSQLYMIAAQLASELLVGVNDSLAAVVMRNKGVTEAYSFDSHLDQLGIKRTVR